ncbi:PREDICTED: uncharacterized protein LOC105561155 [Vollenhovia emeryi]|uniref:uncharacterized protein LOC105561155 n=1 Tax=Vollenhovia emeryi TaxID=411798 RepID=UPI0005F4AF1F|nr:PREDICTED: uncharacterized protein LOC105561155 [Vollenhovia emeryi]
MRAPLVLCVAAVFHTIFVASQGNEDHEIQNSTTTQDVEREANRTKLLLEGILNFNLTTDSLDEEDNCKYRREAYRSRIKRRTTHRPRTKSNAKSRNSKGDKMRQADRVSNKTDFYETKDEGFDVSLWNRTERNADDMQIYDHESFHDYYHRGLESLLKRLIEALENNSRADDPNVPSSSAASSLDDEDHCQKWLNNWEKIERAFPGSVADLPACPCLYPNNIFYENEIWDNKRQKKFRWRDVSHDKDRLTIYKPGAVYCVLTLLSQENESATVQHCCYDESRKLLTRGSGAGTPYMISPDISSLLHDKIDLLPWRLCNGDFTRYNEVRIPNNDNKCDINPDDEEYEHQVEAAKNY